MERAHEAAPDAAASSDGASEPIRGSLFEVITIEGCHPIYRAGNEIYIALAWLDERPEASSIFRLR
jgi:hypothetical protein